MNLRKPQGVKTTLPSSGFGRLTQELNVAVGLVRGVICGRMGWEIFGFFGVNSHMVGQDEPGPARMSQPELRERPSNSVVSSDSPDSDHLTQAFQFIISPLQHQESQKSQQGSSVGITHVRAYGHSGCLTVTQPPRLCALSLSVWPIPELCLVDTFLIPLPPAETFPSLRLHLRGLIPPKSEAAVSYGRCSGVIAIYPTDRTLGKEWKWCPNYTKAEHHLRQTATKCIWGVHLRLKAPGIFDTRQPRPWIP